MPEQGLNQEKQPTPAVHELRVAVFDLSRRAFASIDIDTPSLLVDRQPLDSRGFPGISVEKRAIHVGTRNQLRLPPVDVIGRIFSQDTSTVSGYAVNLRSPVDSDEHSVHLHSLDSVFAVAREEIETGKTDLDWLDARFIMASLALRDIINLAPQSSKSEVAALGLTQ